jgi:hypothetical protein
VIPKKQDPDKVFGPQLANIFQKYCEMVYAETKASGIKVTAEFNYQYERKRGELKMKTFTTPDTLTERMLNPSVPMRRGSKLQHDAGQKLISEMRLLTKKLGGK